MVLSPLSGSASAEVHMNGVITRILCGWSHLRLLVLLQVLFWSFHSCFCMRCPSRIAAGLEVVVCSHCLYPSPAGGHQSASSSRQCQLGCLGRFCSCAWRTCPCLPPACAPSSGHWVIGHSLCTCSLARGYHVPSRVGVLMASSTQSLHTAMVPPSHRY